MARRISSQCRWSRASIVNSRPDHAGQEADDDRHHLAEDVVDLVHNAADVAAHDVGDRVEDRVDELGDPAGVVHEEHHHVVDQLAGLDERGRRVEQPDQPGDAGGDDPVLDEVLDLFEDHLLDVAELFQQHLPEAADSLRTGDDLEDLHALLDGGHRLLADLLDDPVPDVGPGEPEDRGQESDDALDVE